MVRYPRALNRIEFQAALVLCVFQRQYGSEELGQSALFAARWPQGWRRAHCGWPPLMKRHVKGSGWQAAKRAEFRWSQYDAGQSQDRVGRDLPFV